MKKIKEKKISFIKSIKEFVLRRKFGWILIFVGISFQFLNIITYGLWRIDIDIFGALLVLIGIVFTIIFWKKH